MKELLEIMDYKLKRNKIIKKKTVSSKLITSLLLFLIIFNLVGILFIRNLVVKKFESEKGNTMSQTNKTIATGAESFIREYMAVVDMLSDNSIISGFLQSTSL